MNILKILMQTGILVFALLLMTSLAVALPEPTMYVLIALMVLCVVALVKPGVIPGLRKKWFASGMLAVSVLPFLMTIVPRTDHDTSAVSLVEAPAGASASATTGSQSEAPETATALPAAPQPSPAAPPAPTREQQLEAEFLDKLESMHQTVRFLDYSDSKQMDKDQLTTLAMSFSAFAEIYVEGKKLKLSENGNKKLEAYKKLLSDVQRREYPRIRDNFGPAVRKALWEHDGTAKTFGNRFTTIEIVQFMFARNANVKEFNDAWWRLYGIFRFKRIQYKWYPQQNEYNYFTMESPDDGVVATVNRNGAWTAVD